MEHSPEFVTGSLARADQALRAANTLLEAKLLPDAVSRAYYAMFYAATAILYHYGIRTKSHSSAISLFGEHIVKRQLVDKETGKSLRKAFDMRQQSDYAIDIELTGDTVKGLITAAERFVAQIKLALGLTP